MTRLKTVLMCLGMIGLLTLSASHPVGATDANDSETSPAQAELRRPMVNAREMPLYTLHMPPELESTWLFGSNGAPPSPAGFFGEGSDPWSGRISCVGIPLDPKGSAPTSDLIVRHEAIEWIPNPEKRFGPREIPRNFKLRCQMVKLHERGNKPLVVTYDQGKRTEEWEVEVTLAKDHPGGGMIEITWINPDGNGGLADIEIAVKVEFTFTGKKQGRKVSLISDIEWLSETNHEFTRWADTECMKSFTIPTSAQGNFIPASRTIGGRSEAVGKCSRNSRVEHSFTIAPTLETLKDAAPGTLRQIKQFAPRTN